MLFVAFTERGDLSRGEASTCKLGSTREKSETGNRVSTGAWYHGESAGA